MKWVKASERLPEVGNTNIIFRDKNGYPNTTYIYGFNPPQASDFFFEWLDESPLPSNEGQPWKNGNMKDCLELVRSALSAKIAYSKDADLKKDLQKTVNSINICLDALPSNEDEFKDLALEAMDFYWRHCIDQLERKDLGDIERKNFETLRNKLHYFITK